VQIQDALDAVAGKVNDSLGLDVWTDPAKEPIVPGVEVADTNVVYHDTMGRGQGYHVLTFTVTVFLARSDTLTAVDDARRYLSPSGDDSVYAAVEATSSESAFQAITARNGSLGLTERSGGRFVVARVEFDSRIKES